jgi:hypothetical protein
MLPAYTNVVSVHQWNMANTLLVGLLGAGDRFDDDANGFHISVLRIDTAARVAVVRSAATAIAPTRVVVVSPSPMPRGAPDAAPDTAAAPPLTCRHTLTVTNRDTNAPMDVFVVHVAPPPSSLSVRVWLEYDGATEMISTSPQHNGGHGTAPQTPRYPPPREQSPVVDASNTAAAAGASSDAVVCNELQLVIRADDFPDETAWRVRRRVDGFVVAAGGATTTSVSLCDAGDVEYVVEMLDTFGDGMCCSRGAGHFAIKLNGAEVYRGGEFGAVDAVVIVNGAAVAVPLLSATASTLQVVAEVVPLSPDAVARGAAAVLPHSLHVRIRSGSGIAAHESDVDVPCSR